MFRGLGPGSVRYVGALLLLGFAGIVGRNIASSRAVPQPLPQPTIVHHEIGVLSPGGIPTAKGSPARAAISGLIDLNSASLQELEALPGVGAVKAARILEDRKANGPFGSPAELGRVEGFGAKSVARLLPYLTTGGGPAPDGAATLLPAATPLFDDSAIRTARSGRDVAVAVQAPSQASPPASAPSPQSEAKGTRPVRVNQADVEGLQMLIGVGPAMARRIVEDRYRNGHYRRAEDLLRVKGIGPKTLERNRHLLRFD